jgi:hypothetical protein
VLSFSTVIDCHPRGIAVVSNESARSGVMSAPPSSRFQRAGLQGILVSAYAETLRALGAELEAQTGWLLPPAGTTHPWARLSRASDELDCRLAEGLASGGALRGLSMRLNQHMALGYAAVVKGGVGAAGAPTEALRLSMGACWRQSLRRLQAVVEGAAAPAQPRGSPGPDAQSCASSPSSPRLCIFSGHDSTLFPLMMSLLPDVWGCAVAPDPVSGHDSMWTPFCGDLAIELWKSSTAQSSGGGDHVVKVLYNGERVPHAAAGEDGFCTFEAWCNFLAPYLPKQGSVDGGGRAGGIVGRIIRSAKAGIGIGAPRANL